jgi:gliding motility-associated lipoprotein GldD
MNRYTILFSVILCLSACTEEGMPKPKGYFRIDFPTKKYQSYSANCPLSFEYPVYCLIEQMPVKSEDGKAQEKCRFNISFPIQKARLHFSLFEAGKDLPQMIEETRKLAYKHVIKASAIDELDIYEPNKKLYGTVYEIGGNTASNIQFYATDSAQHFLRGSLYFWASPNADSLAPVLSFIRADIKHLISTLEWKN